MTFDEYFAVLENCGWFQAYSEPTKVRLATNLKRGWEDNPAYAVYSLGDAAWDPEDASGADAAEEILKSLTRVSEGQFQAEGLTYENFKKDDGGRTSPWCRVSFVHGGQPVAIELYRGDREDYEGTLVRACNDALAGAGCPYRFYQVPSGDQCYYFAFVTPEAYSAVEGRGWLKVQKVGNGVWGAIV